MADNNIYMFLRDDLGKIEGKRLFDPLGNPVFNPDGRPMFAPRDYDPGLHADLGRQLGKGSSFGSLFEFGRNHVLDLQRNYNGLQAQGGDGFVKGFQDVASWAFGYYGAFDGFKLQTLLGGGGIHNLIGRLNNPNIDINGWLGNNPDNVPNIIAGYDAALLANPYDFSAVTGEPRTGYTGNHTGFRTPSEELPMSLRPNPNFSSGGGLPPPSSPQATAPSPISYRLPSTTGSDAVGGSNPSSYDAPVGNLSPGSSSGGDHDPWAGLRDGPDDDGPSQPNSGGGNPPSGGNNGGGGSPNNPSTPSPRPSTPSVPSPRPPNAGGGPNEGTNSGPGNPGSGSNGGGGWADAISDAISAAASWVSSVVNSLTGGPPVSPVLLDLEGNGFDVDPLGSSAFFADLNGDGQQARLAWAGKGTGVLVIDADGDGKIGQEKEFAFTKWDANAKTDLEAIKNVFDTNGNGRLDTGDARWGEFKVWVNGSLVTLGSLGITSIGLTPSGSGQTFADGSAITGTASYSMGEGQNAITRDVGDAVLASDNARYLVDRQVITQTNGTTVTTISARHLDGSLAFRNYVSETADGKYRVTQYDDDGNGTVDRSQTDELVINANGSRARTIANINADGSLANRTITTTSVDGKTVTTTVDQDGDWIADQSQTYAKYTDNSSTTTTKQLNALGGTLSQTVVTSTANGLTKWVQTDANGDGVFENVRTETIVVNANISRSTTIADTSANGTLIGTMATWTSADNRSKVVDIDHAGDGSYDVRESRNIVINGAGAVSTYTSTTNADGTARGASSNTVSANGLTRTSTADVNGDGVNDFTGSDVTVVAANGSRVQTVEQRSGNGTLLGKTVTSTSADKKTITVSSDINGDGINDAVKTVVIAANGATTETVNTYDANGVLETRTESTTSSDGLSTTTRTDVTGDGLFERTVSDVKVLKADGSWAETVTELSDNNTLIRKSVATSSADGLTQKVEQDINGDNFFDLATTKTVALNSNGSRTETVATTSADRTVLSKTITMVSADRKTATVSIDANGDNHADQTVTSLISASGSQCVTTNVLNAAGAVMRTSTVAISADGLTKTTVFDVNADTLVDHASTDIIVFNADGSRTETVSELARNNALLSKSTTTVSGNGLSTTMLRDYDGNTTIDEKLTEVTVINANGSVTTTTGDFVGSNNVLVGREIVTTSANGLTSTIDVDRDGNGTVDTKTTKASTIYATGATDETLTQRAGDGSLISRESTYVSADKKTVYTTTDINGDGLVDETRCDVLNNDGSTSTTISTLGLAGALVSKTSVTESDDGLVTSAYIDNDGNGTIDQTTTSATTLNIDGSVTTITRNYLATGALKDQATVTVSADSLTKTTLWDAKGTGVINRSSTETTVLDIYGGTTQTVSFYKTGNVLESRTTTITSTDKLTTTVTEDINGNGLNEYKSVSVLGADGVRTTTNANLGVDGITIIGKTVVSAYLDLWTTIARYGNGTTFDGWTKIENATNANGSAVQTTSEFTSGNVLKSKEVVTTSGSGLYTTQEWDLTGAGTYGRVETQLTTLNADGSTTSDICRYGLGVVTREVTTTSGNGLVITTQWASSQSGPFDQSSTDVTMLNADGTQTRSVTNTKAGGVLISKSVSTLSADGHTLTIEEDNDGINGFERTRVDNTVARADGGSVETISTLNGLGQLKAKEVITRSGDDATVTYSRDGDGNGSFDQTEIDANYVDGSRSFLTTGFLNGVKSNQTITSVSADQLRTVTGYDTDGNGTFEQKRISVNTINADGSTKLEENSYAVSFATSTNTNTLVQSLESAANGVLKSSRTAITSADGRTTTITQDLNGDGVNDRTIISITDVTGAVTTVTANNAEARKMEYLSESEVHWGSFGGVTPAMITSTMSADKLTDIIKADFDGDGTQEFTEIARKQIDGSVISTITDSGLWPGVGTRTVSSDGLTTVLTRYEQPGTLSLFGESYSVSVATTRVDGTVENTGVTVNLSGQVLMGSIEIVSASGIVISSQYFDQATAPAMAAANSVIAAAISITINGTSANDTLNGTTSGDRILGLAGDDTLYGGTGDDMLFGNDGTDIVNGGTGNDVLDAGAGVTGSFQYLYGMAGDDTYVYSKDDKAVFIGGNAEAVTGGTADRVKFTDLNLKDVSFAFLDMSASSPANGNCLRITWTDGGTSGELRIGLEGQHIETYEFADGTTLSKIQYDATYGWTLTGTASNDYIHSGSGNDLIYGGNGNDILDAGTGTGWQYLAGQAGDDTYVYSKENRNVGIRSWGESAATGTADRVRFTDLSLKDITFGYYDYGVTNPGEGVALRALWNDGLSSGEVQISNGGFSIEAYEFADGTTLSKIEYDVANTMWKFSGTAGNDYIHSGSGNDLIYGGNGNDVLDAGGGTATGWQYLAGQTGDDTYVYSKENRNVGIRSWGESATTGAADRLKFTDLSLKDLSFANVTYAAPYAAEGTALRLLWNDGTSSGELQISNGGLNIETYEFADGTTLSKIQYDATYGWTLTGTASNDYIHSGSGNDLIYGGNGNDILDAGTGTGWQYLAGQAGDDTYVYSKENRNVGIRSWGESAATGTADRVRFTDLSLKDITFGYYDYGVTNPGEGVALRALWNDGLSSGEVQISNGGFSIEAYEFADGTTLSKIEYDVANTMWKFSGTAGNDYIHSGSGNDLIYGGNGNDVLDAGGGTATGWQYLAGQTGDDTYVYSKENRNVGIRSWGESATTGAADRLKFTDLSLKDLSFANVTYAAPYAAEGTALRLLWNDGTSSGELQISNGGLNIETYEFADGTTLSKIEFNSTTGVSTLTATANGDLVRGTNGVDVIYGLAGNDILDAGYAADWMQGGTGNDTYYVDNVYDTTYEIASEGFDEVYASVSFTIAANVETLYLSGTGNINGTGNTNQGDVITGNSGANTLIGLGGNDYLYGGAGDDWIEGGAGADFIVGQAGSDYSSYANSSAGVSVSLVAGAVLSGGDAQGDTLSGIENLCGSAFADGLNGDGQANLINGLGGNDVIAGGDGNDSLYGGLGVDTLWGGTGADSFFFDTALTGAANTDTISDFVAVDDTIILENAVFTQLIATGTMAANLFKNVIGGVIDADDRILYNSNTGALSYDPDGSGAGAAIQFATLTTLPVLTNADFYVT
jgi:trimeric autotransporter adhesin